MCGVLLGGLQVRRRTDDMTLCQAVTIVSRLSHVGHGVEALTSLTRKAKSGELGGEGMLMVGKRCEAEGSAMQDPSPCARREGGRPPGEVCGESGRDAGPEDERKSPEDTSRGEAAEPTFPLPADEPLWKLVNCPNLAVRPCPPPPTPK